MKRIALISVACFMLLSGTALAAPLDLIGFLGEPADLAYSDGNTISLEEDSTGAIGYVYFANDSYFVADNAVSLTFDYEFTLQPGDVDWLVVQINGLYTTEILGDNSSANDQLVLIGSESIDLTSYQGSPIVLVFGLEYDLDDAAYSSFASFSNLDVSTPTAPVPEPATFLLLGTAIAALAGFKKKLH